MCLAIYAPKGTDKKSDKLIEAIKVASITNDDGMGYAFKRNSTKKVFLSKGYKDVNLFIEEINSKKLGLNDELIIHLRIGNKGAVNTDMCHPFVASDDHDEILTNDKFCDKPVFIHNGTLIKYSEYHSNFSDTYFFAKKFLSKEPVQNFLKEDSALFGELFKDHVGISRFAILFPNVDTDGILLGDFTEDEGYFFSNKSYVSSKYKNVGGEYITNNKHDDYDDYTNDYYNNLNIYNQNVYDASKRKISNLNTLAVNKSVAEYENDLPFEIDETNDKQHSMFPSKKAMFRVPSGVLSEVITDLKTKTSYRFYMGFWVPSDKKLVELHNLKIDVNELNYKTVRLKCLNEFHNIHLKIDSFYKVFDFDFNSKVSNRIHKLIPFNIKSGLQPSISGDAFVDSFDIRPAPSHILFYDKYFELVRDLTISKNELKRLTKLLNKNLDKKSIKYKNMGYVSRELLDLYLFNMYKQYFPANYMEEYNKRTI